MRDPAKTVLLDEAELMLAFFAFITRRDPLAAQGSAHEVLGRIEAIIEEQGNGRDQYALILAADMTEIAMEWFTGTINAQAMAAGLGELARKISKHEARQ